MWHAAGTLTRSESAAPALPKVTSETVRRARAHRVDRGLRFRKSKGDEDVTDDGPTGRILGVHLVAGAAALALIDQDGSLLDVDDVRRLVPSSNLDIGLTERDYLARARQIVRGWRPDTVAVLNTRSYANWKYADAFARITVETCWRLAAAEEDCALVLIKQEHAAKVLGVNRKGWKSTDLVAAVADRVDARPLYWDKRSLAYVAALVASPRALNPSSAGQPGE